MIHVIADAYGSVCIARAERVFAVGLREKYSSVSSDAAQEKRSVVNNPGVNGLSDQLEGTQVPRDTIHKPSKTELAAVTVEREPEVSERHMVKNALQLYGGFA